MKMNDDGIISLKPRVTRRRVALVLVWPVLLVVVLVVVFTTMLVVWPLLLTETMDVEDRDE